METCQGCSCSECSNFRLKPRRETAGFAFARGFLHVWGACPFLPAVGTLRPACHSLGACCEVFVQHLVKCFSADFGILWCLSSRR